MREEHFNHITSHRYRVLRAKEELKDNPSFKRKGRTQALVKLYLLEDLSGFYKSRYERKKLEIVEINDRISEGCKKALCSMIKVLEICTRMCQVAVDLCESRIESKDYKVVNSSIDERALIRASKGKLKLDELMVDIYSKLARDPNQAKKLFDSIVESERIDLDLDKFKANDDKEQPEPYTDEKSRIDHLLDAIECVNAMLEMPAIEEGKLDKLFAAIDTVKKFAVACTTEKQTNENIDPAGIRNAIDGLEKTIEKMRKVAEMFDVNIDDTAECDDTERKVYLEFNIDRLQELKRCIEADINGQGADGN